MPRLLIFPENFASYLSLGRLPPTALPEAVDWRADHSSQDCQWYNDAVDDESKEEEGERAEDHYEDAQNAARTAATALDLDQLVTAFLQLRVVHFRSVIVIILINAVPPMDSLLAREHAFVDSFATFVGSRARY